MALKLSELHEALREALEAEDRLVNNGVVDGAMTTRVPVAADEAVVRRMADVLAELEISDEGAVVVWDGRALPTVQVTNQFSATGAPLRGGAGSTIPPPPRRYRRRRRRSPMSSRSSSVGSQACLLAGKSPRDIVVVNQNVVDFAYGLRTAADR